ncbi:MFS transporter [Massilia sp. BJB1822]|uniref:MFS transporter n=1 Tax=Massilia sp. BJB1822 TaxID=2744470 RepID=UPI001592F9A1|nr:MFS transporter [Massilia sp. BJB1822]NVD98878.1 MFS transporter [Massilia sp. BJB1822]
MANPYRKLFRAPGSRGFALAALLARMPISMTGIGLITMLAQMRGAYGLAGAVAATFAFCTALLSPQVSRLVDRYGQGRVLPRAAGASIAAMLALLLCAHLQAPDWTLFVFAALAGCMPSMSAMSRARWTEIYRGQPELQTAYALESVLDEVCFIAGPPISVGLSVAVFPEAGPLAALLLLGLGVAAFVLQRATEPPVHARVKGYQAPLLAQNGMRVLMLLMVAMGTIAGTVDVVSVAFARQEGEPAAASIVLSMYAIGSCVAGLAFGALRLQQPLPQLLRLAGLATAATTLPLLFVNNILSLSAAVLLAGLFFAPTLIVAMGLVERMVPNARLTEGLTWLVTGLGIGLALGAAAAGQLVDMYGARAGFGMALAAGCVVLFTVLYGQCHLEEVAAPERQRSAG